MLVEIERDLALIVNKSKLEKTDKFDIGGIISNIKRQSNIFRKLLFDLFLDLRTS